MNLKSLIPKSLKLKFKLIKRFFLDLNINFASNINHEKSYIHSISTNQEIMQGAFFENKIHNLKTATKKIDGLIVKPNEIFSFWKIVGFPNEKNNFKKGRNIVKEKVSEEIGGGLCQLSSIIYITALKANLEIVERYNHSVDIYKEHERFTPLGSDATVVYGYKDLRIKNNYNFSITFSILIIENKITFYIFSQNKINEFKLDFKRNYKAKKIEVITTLNNVETYISTFKTMEL